MDLRVAENALNIHQYNLEKGQFADKSELDLDRALGNLIKRAAKMQDILRS